MNAAVGDHDGAGDAIGGHVRQRRSEGGEESCAVGFAVRLAGLDDAFALERSGLSVLLRTDDVGEGMRAFLEKRRPDFKGR